MAGLDRYRSDDRRALEALYRRTLGTEAAERLKLTWAWERRQNPAARGADAPWVVREGTALIAALVPQPVRVSLAGADVRGAWLVDPLVASERTHPGGGRALPTAGRAVRRGIERSSLQSFRAGLVAMAGHIVC